MIGFVVVMVMLGVGVVIASGFAVYTLKTQNKVSILLSMFKMQNKILKM